jgi:hypothetical protein
VEQVDWHSDLRVVLDDWAQGNPEHHVIISPDVDGLASAAILHSLYELKIIGIYTTTHLLLLDDHDTSQAKNALWLDHDISQIGIRCVGQHLVHHQPTDVLPLRDSRSWNPNVWVKQAWSGSFKGTGGRKRDKYPYGTAHFLWDLAFGRVSPSPEVSAVLAHADGTWFALDCYKANGAIWKDLMFQESAWVENLLNYREAYEAHITHKIFADELLRIGYSSQSRSPKANLLPEELKPLVGRQSLRVRITSDTDRYLNRLKEGLDLIGSYLGSIPDIGLAPREIFSGKRVLEYPNRIEDFDELMQSKQIFSHAFTDFRSLSYTINLSL